MTSTGAGTVDELLPQRPRKALPKNVKPVPKQALREGDLICAECGTGNGQTRKFCRQCGASLAEAEVVKSPWWRKLLPHRRKRVMVAGTRPGRAGAKRDRRKTTKAIYYKLRTLVAVAILVVGIVFAAYPPARKALTDRLGRAKQGVSSLHPGLTAAHPTKVTGTARDPAVAADKAFDGHRETYWLAPFNVDKPPTLTITLDRKKVLKQVIITSGDEANFVAHGRPRVIKLDFSNGNSRLLSLKDQPKPQTLSITGGVGVDHLSIIVEDTYKPTGSHSTDVAVAEIEFFSVL
jgi:hypothetical protein